MLIEFRVGASHTFNLGNFESFRVEALVAMSVKEGDDYNELRTKAQTELKQLLTDTYQEQRRKDRKNERQ